MFYKDEEQHQQPHFHAVYADYSASYSFDGNVIAGSLPQRQHKLVVAWAELHQEELAALWRVMQESGEYFTIKGLE